MNLVNLINIKAGQNVMKSKYDAIENHQSIKIMYKYNVFRMTNIIF